MSPLTCWALPLGLVGLVALLSLLAPPLPPPAAPAPLSSSYVLVLVAVVFAALGVVLTFAVKVARILRRLYDLEGSIDDRVPGDAHFRYLTVGTVLEILAITALQLVSLLASRLTALMAAAPAGPARRWRLVGATLYNAILFTASGVSFFEPVTPASEALTASVVAVGYLLRPLLLGAVVSILIERRKRERQGIEDRQPTQASLNAHTPAPHRWSPLH